MLKKAWNAALKDNWKLTFGTIGWAGITTTVAFNGPAYFTALAGMTTVAAAYVTFLSIKKSISDNYSKPTPG